MAFNMALIQLNMAVFFPVPPGMDASDPEQFNTYIQALPNQAFLLVVIAHLGQSFLGGWIAARLGSSRPMLLALIVGFVSLMGGVAAILTIPGPSWMVLEIPLYLAMAFMAGRMEQTRRKAVHGGE